MAPHKTFVPLSQHSFQDYMGLFQLQKKLNLARFVVFTPDLVLPNKKAVLEQLINEETSSLFSESHPQSLQNT